MQLNSAKLLKILDGLLGSDIRYHMDGMQGKARPISRQPSELRWLDCSGFTEYVMHHATDDHTDIPAGSRRQWSWFENNHYVEVDYPTFGPRRDDVLRIGFRAAVRRDGRRVRAGHVWFVINGRTFECTTRGNNNGPCSLDWADRSDECAAFFTIGCVAGFGLFSWFWPDLRAATRPTVSA